MGAAAAALGWRPREFWAATPPEFWDAMNGYERMHRLPAEEG
ncbi:phage tail assembly chaperone [Microvirga sp. SRT01]|uniref:Phage tail assembly chaperone n=1 Tax=Sphingomonas longa TaxID=2778730 RepID=A0ABS2D5Z7_9SPHN|nr:phage tail assembly chaperone [Sphingomonas sp. BT552]MBR7709388.1 phage tail assembly chaperone [Microvirga sp. SRT01]